jgi:hypothetical protein
MAERRADERQSDLFGEGARKTRPPARELRRQERRPGERAGSTDDATGPARPQAEATLAELAAGATPSELDELIRALTDAGLAHLAVASVRALRRRLAKPGASGARGRKGRVGALERAAHQLAAELGGSAPGDDA